MTITIIPTPDTTDANKARSTIPLLIANNPIQSDNVFEVQSPMTGNVVHHCVGATVDDADAAVSAAKAAFPEWSKKSPYERRDVLLRAADIMASRREELIECQVEETGAMRVFAEKTFDLGVSFLRDVAGRIPSIQGAVPSVSEAGETAMVFKEPYGVILGIVPWYVMFVVVLYGSRAVELTPTGLGMRHLSSEPVPSPYLWQPETQLCSRALNSLPSASGFWGISTSRLVFPLGV